VPLLGTTFSSPTMSINPKELSFGRQEVLTRSAPKTVTVTNIGGSDLAIRRVYIGTTTSCDNPRDYTIVAGLVSPYIPIAFGHTRTISIVFQPTGLDYRACLLQFESNAGQHLSVPLRGWATPRK
jgi:hypothetical protein